MARRSRWVGIRTPPRNAVRVEDSEVRTGALRGGGEQAGAGAITGGAGATVVLTHRSERGARTVLARAADQDGRQESACTARAGRRGERPGEGVSGGACVS